MNAITPQRFIAPFPGSRGASDMDTFRERFQRSLRSCLRRGFSLEESFGMIWVETWEEISISEEEQSLLYDELIRWAKNAVR